MWIWIDLFLQLFVQALAWCLAFILSATLLGGGLWLMVCRNLKGGECCPCRRKTSWRSSGGPA